MKHHHTLKPLVKPSSILSAPPPWFPLTPPFYLTKLKTIHTMSLLFPVSTALILQGHLRSPPPGGASIVVSPRLQVPTSMGLIANGHGAPPPLITPHDAAANAAAVSAAAAASGKAPSLLLSVLKRVRRHLCHSVVICIIFLAKLDQSATLFSFFSLISQPLCLDTLFLCQCQYVCLYVVLSVSLDSLTSLLSVALTHDDSVRFQSSPLSHVSYLHSIPFFIGLNLASTRTTF